MYPVLSLSKMIDDMVEMALLRVTERNQNKRNVLHDDLYHGASASAMVSLFFFFSSSSLLTSAALRGTELR